jgi:hypothetical protein
MMIAHLFHRLDDHRLGRREALSTAGHRIGLIGGEHRKPPTRPGGLGLTVTGPHGATALRLLRTYAE